MRKRSSRLVTALAWCWTALVVCSPAYGQRIESVSIPVGSMDATSHPADTNVWSVRVPAYPLDVRTGIGVLVNPFFFPSGELFVLHDHQYLEPHVPDPDRAVVTFRFDQPVTVRRVEIVQHTNGITQVEGLAGDSLESLSSIGAVFGPAGDVTGAEQFAEGERQTFQFEGELPGRVFQLVVRKTSLSDGWASYRIYPVDAAGNRIQGAVLQGAVSAWGDNSARQVGVSDASTVPTPAALPAVPDAIALGAGMFHSLAARADGSVWAWGQNSSGQLGPGVSGGSSFTPTQVPGVASAMAVTGGWHQSYALRGDGTVLVWGSGYTGLGGYSSFVAPTQIPGLSDVVALAVGEATSYALRADGTVWSWGFNGSGELGTGSGDSAALSPVLIPTLQDVVGISTHFAHALALTREGRVWAWGYNAAGEIGDGTFTNRSVPVQVPGLADVVQVAAGAFNSYALTRDGVVWTWGQHGTSLYLPSPVPIGELDGVTAIASGGFHLLARKADRSLWGWGDNRWGQLGLSTQPSFEWVAMPVVGVGQADLLTAGRVHSLATFPVDAAAPVITVPETVYADATSSAGAVVDYTVTAVDDLDPAPTLGCTPPTGSLFPQLGPTTVECIATDAAGHVTSAFFDVIVKDANWQLEDIAGLIGSWQLPSLGTSLVDKILKAQVFVQQGKLKQACDTLKSFLNQVKAQTGSGLTLEQAADLTTRVERVRNVLGC